MPVVVLLHHSLSFDFESFLSAASEKILSMRAVRDMYGGCSS